MIISGSINEFVNNYTKSILESMDNVKLWQFSVTKSNSYNIKREYDEIEQNDFGLWSKPGNYDKYEDKNNVLLITDNENTHVLSFKGCDNPGRKWWDDKHTQNGSHWIGMYMDINKKIIGYWDSYGYNPPNEVVDLMNKLKQQSKDNLTYA